MTTYPKTALVIGAGRGTGRALALKLANAGTRVSAMARSADDLDTLQEQHPGLSCITGDAASGIAQDLMGDLKPDLLALVGGTSPRMVPFVDLDWDGFSASWNSDTKATFDFLKAAVTTPLSRDATIVTFSSGAAISGSTLSGGYAGAKRMQHYLTNYTAWESDRRDLGLRCFTVYPQQLIADTLIGDAASDAYATARGVTQSDFMAQWDRALTPDLLASRVMDLIDRDQDHAPGAWGITGTDMTQMT